MPIKLKYVVYLNSLLSLKQSSWNKYTILAEQLEHEELCSSLSTISFI